MRTSFWPGFKPSSTNQPSDSGWANSISCRRNNSALVRHEGEVFVYVQTSDELFLRQEIELDHPLSEGWFVDEGLKPGQKLVLTGAQQLLSEELKGEGRE